MIKNQKKLLSIVIVSYNSSSTIGATINAVLNQTLNDFSFLIIDNNSQDKTVSYIHYHFPDIEVIANNQNFGFCKAHNIGIRATQSTYHAVLNPDVILHEDYYKILIEHLKKDTTAGMAAGKLYLGKPKNKGQKRGSIIDSTGIIIDRKRRSLDRGQLHHDSGQYDTTEYVFGVSGAAAVYRRTMLEDIKINNHYFDETFFVYREDTDLSWRAQLYGWNALYNPQAIAFHKRRNMPQKRKEMPPDINMHSVKNRIIMIMKNENIRGLARDGIFYIIYETIIFFYLALFEQQSLRAYRIVYKNLPHILRWRKIIKSNKKVSSSTINAWFTNAVSISPFPHKE